MTTQQTGSAIDTKTLRELLYDNLDGCYPIYVQVLEAFLNETPKTLAKVRMALSTRDLAPVARAVHSMRSNALTVGAMRLGGLCREFEEAHHEGRIQALAELTSALEAEFQSCRAVLAAELERAQPHLQGGKE